MALTKKDLENIEGIVDKSIDRKVPGIVHREVSKSEDRLSIKIDESEDRVIRRIDRAVDDVTSVILSGHNMISDKFQQLDEELDSVTRPWRD